MATASLIAFGRSATAADVAGRSSTGRRAGDDRPPLCCFFVTIGPHLSRPSALISTGKFICINVSFTSNCLEHFKTESQVSSA